MNHKLAVAPLLFFVLTGAAYAGISGPSTYGPTLIGNSKTSTKAYAGLNWEIPGNIAPALVLGVRRAKVESDGDTQGGDLSFSMALAGGVKPGKLRLKGFTGQENYQGELGGGYDFSNNGFFFGPSVNFPYVNVGADWQPNAGLKFYGMLHTVGKYKEPAATPSCDPGDFYNSGTGLCEIGG